MLCSHPAGRIWKAGMASNLTIVDASLVIKAILPNPEFRACQSVLTRLQHSQLVAPALWVYEITSSFAKAVHFKQITEEEGRSAIRQALALGIQVILPDETQSLLAYAWTLKLHRASAYDSFYLAIAEALEAELWTADRHLFSSLESSNFEWLHWIGEEN
jgi:predicted nucleic acid-binding protein